MFEPLHPYIAKAWENISLLIVAGFKVKQNPSARISGKQQ